MSIKLIAFDIDGTIVDSENNVSPANEKAIKEVVAKGIPVVLVTGRHRDGTRKVINDLGLDFDSIPLIINNGALVYIGKEIIWRDFLTSEEADEVIKYTTKIPGVATMVFQPDQIYLHCNLPLDRDALLEELKIFGVDHPYIADDPDELTRQDVSKVMLVTENGDKALSIYSKWPEKISHLKLSRSYSHLCEINSRTCDKGRGLKVLCEKLGILPEEVLAVGDGENDIAMLAFAKNAVFVRHSDKLPPLPSHVIVTPKGYENDGAAWAITKVVFGN